MKITEMSWMQVEAHVGRDDRAVLPIGSTEQHAYLSLATDSILAERVAVDAADPLGVPVFPALAYGLTPQFSAYPGTVTLRLETFLTVIRELLDSIAESGFRRILVVNGHGGNAPAQAAASEWAARRPDTKLKFHNWWNAPATMAKVRSIDPAASHASWMESFPWTRVVGVQVPTERKPMVDWASIGRLAPGQIRERLGDGSFGGLYQRADQEMAEIWAVAVEETRALLTGDWG